MADSGRPGIPGGGEHETASIVDRAGLLEDGDGFIAERDAVFGFVRPSCRVFTPGPRLVGDPSPPRAASCGRRPRRGEVRPAMPSDRDLLKDLGDPLRH